MVPEKVYVKEETQTSTETQDNGLTMEFNPSNALLHPVDVFSTRGQSGAVTWNNDEDETKGGQKGRFCFCFLSLKGTSGETNVGAPQRETKMQQNRNV